MKGNILERRGITNLVVMNNPFTFYSHFLYLY